MSKRAVFLSLAVVILAAGVAHPAEQNTGTWLKSSYLKTIHDDCRVFLEGIELFVERDYDEFLKNVQSGGAVSGRDADAYIKELRHFEKLVDSVYEEYISFREARIASADKKDYQERSLSRLEKRIYQMLAYCYLRTGDIVMAENIIKNNDILTDDFTIRIRGLDGQLKDFYLTKQLTTLYKTTTSMLTTLTLNVKNFYISDIQEINAYIQIEDYDPQEPVNILYMAYYGRLLPGLGEKDRRMIHMGQIIDFFNRLKYSSSASAKPFLKGKTSSYAVSYQFPIVKGTYDVINKDPTIRVRSVSDNEITVERLCRFKGLARTDFRNLKAAEKQQRREETIVAENLTLFRMDDKSMTAYSAGQMMPYGIYALFEKEDHLGTVELVPCGKGGSCKEGTSQDPAVTLVKIFDHEFVLYKDVLDLIKRNHNRHGSDIAYDPAGNWKEFRRRSEGGEQKALRLFPGCVAPADVK